MIFGNIGTEPVLRLIFKTGLPIKVPRKVKEMIQQKTTSLGELLCVPGQLTPMMHLEVLLKLKKSLEELKKNLNENDPIQKIRIRNWLFFKEEGNSVVDVVIDKGYESNVAWEFLSSADTRLTFDECAQVHAFIAESNAFDDFASEVEIRFGSPGSEPTLFDVKDYKSSLNDMVRVDLWSPLEGRSRFLMILVDILKKSGNTLVELDPSIWMGSQEPQERDDLFIVLGEGSLRYELPLSSVKQACALPFHPHSKLAQSKKKSLKKKAPKKSH